MSTTNHPWQNGPTELIEFALQRIQREADFDKRLAFLLLDVGVETLFKTFLTLPPEVTHAQGSYGDRKQAAEGNFHDLVRGIEKAAGSRLSDLNLAHVQFYHDLRNKLYHQGNGITIPTDKAQGYAALVVDLLNRLLEIDLSEKLNEPQRRAEKKTSIDAKKREIQKYTKHIRGVIADVEALLQSAIEAVEPKLVLPSFVAQFNKICGRYVTEEFYGDEQAIIKFSSDTKARIEFSNTIAELVGNAITNQELRARLLRRTNLRLNNPDKYVEMEEFADYLLRDNYPDVFSVYFGILDILVGANDWKIDFDFAYTYPATIGPPSDYEEEQLLDLQIADAGERVKDLTRMSNEISTWAKAQGH